MENNVQTFLSTSDVMRMLGIGNKTCLNLFHRKDFQHHSLSVLFPVITFP